MRNGGRGGDDAALPLLSFGRTYSGGIGCGCDCCFLSVRAVETVSWGAGVDFCGDGLVEGEKLFGRGGVEGGYDGWSGKDVGICDVCPRRNG